MKLSDLDAVTELANRRRVLTDNLRKLIRGDHIVVVGIGPQEEIADPVDPDLRKAAYDAVLDVLSRRLNSLDEELKVLDVIADLPNDF